MNKKLIIIALLITLAALWGCRRTEGGPAYYGGGEEGNVVEGSEVVGEIVPADKDVGEQVDEFAGGGEFSTTATGTVEPAGTAEATTTTTTGTTATTTGATVTGATGGVVDGYRVQIIASSYEDNANRVADQVRAAYAGTGVYVQHIQNLYKVRVGDFRDRGAAEAMRDKLKSAGYTDAWIVKEQVNAQ